MCYVIRGTNADYMAWRVPNMNTAYIYLLSTFGPKN